MLNYSLKHFAALKRYLNYGSLPAGSNRVKNQIGPIAVDRGNSYSTEPCALVPARFVASEAKNSDSACQSERFHQARRRGDRGLRWSEDRSAHFAHR